MHNPGCERWDSNPRYPAYEAGDLAACPLRNGCGGWIRTTVLQLMGLARSASSLLRNIQGGMFFRSEPPRPHMKGNENRNKKRWQSGRLSSFVFRTTTKRNIIFDYSA